MKRIEIITLSFVLLVVPAVGSAKVLKGAKDVRHRVSFDETYDRYPAPYDLFFHIDRLLPHLQRDQLNFECQRLGEENTTVLGGNLPNFGAPLENEPGALFTELYARCLDNAFDVALRNGNETTRGNLIAIFGEKLTAELEGIPPGFGTWSDFPTWGALPKDLQTRLLERLLVYVVGPDEILEDKDLIGTNSVFGPEVQTKSALLALLERKSLENAPQKNLFSVIRGSTILLRLGPTILRQ